MKVRCPCSATISDTTDDLPYKGRLRSDEDDVAYQLVLDRDARAMAEAYRGERSETIARASLEQALQELGLAAALLERQVYECPDCGRLLVRARDDAMRFIPFLPETEVRGVLRSVKPE